jgi:acyl-CoA synthetase (AMP-forming)/AMP-acid ligase II
VNRENSRYAQNTIPDLLSRCDEHSPALGSVEETELSYGQLWTLVRRAHENFRAYGLKRTDVVAISLRNSPDTATIILALITYCRVAPLNPGYTLREVVFALRDLEAVALIASPEQTDALGAAEQLGVRIIRLAAASGSASSCVDKLPERRPDDLSDANLVKPDDVALLLHTSGTTSRPKLVPLTHRNLCLSSQAVAEVLQLRSGDRCLSIMPMFHIHGLVAGLLASIAAGACTVCAPGFQATSFFSWLHSSRATWYTGVPTMHQAILARVRHNSHILARHRLRVIRSSSSPLYPAVWQQLETVFGVQVLNSYGMTEAAHQIASVRIRKASGLRSSVGMSSGPEMAIRDANGRILATGERGEVVLRGQQIMSAYLEPAEANEAAFHDGWFCTGDEGWMDADGVLTLTGRLKEMINSGGEKISPYEVEDVLLMHPAVAEAVAFAAPHAMLGEQVIAAVVVRDGQRVLERELLKIASRRLARCKLPKQVLFVDDIPRGATGKLQRIGLADRLGISGQ